MLIRRNLACISFDSAWNTALPAQVQAKLKAKSCCCLTADGQVVTELGQISGEPLTAVAKNVHPLFSKHVAAFGSNTPTSHAARIFLQSRLAAKVVAAGRT